MFIVSGIYSFILPVCCLSNKGKPSSAHAEDEEVDPLELLYVAQCSDMLLRTLSEAPPPPEGPPGSSLIMPPASSVGESSSSGMGGGADGSVRRDSVAEPLADERDEYERFGAHPKLAALARDSFLALQREVASPSPSSGGGLPAEWRRINVMYPPYAMMQQSAQPDDESEESEMTDSPAFRREASELQVSSGSMGLYGPQRPPPFIQR